MSDGASCRRSARRGFAIASLAGEIFPALFNRGDTRNAERAGGAISAFFASLRLKEGVPGGAGFLCVHAWLK